MKGNKGKKKNKKEMKETKSSKEATQKSQNNENSDFPKCIQVKDCKIILNVHAKPGSKKKGICEINDESIEIAVHAQAQNNKANFAIIDYLSDILNVSKSNIQFESGTTNRDKSLSITGIDAKDLFDKLKDNLI